jgi:hypothetical protein
MKLQSCMLWHRAVWQVGRLGTFRQNLLLPSQSWKLSFLLWRWKDYSKRCVDLPDCPMSHHSRLLVFFAVRRSNFPKYLSIFCNDCKEDKDSPSTVKYTKLRYYEVRSAILNGDSKTERRRIVTGVQLHVSDILKQHQAAYRYWCAATCFGYTETASGRSLLR